MKIRYTKYITNIILYAVFCIVLLGVGSMSVYSQSLGEGRHYKETHMGEQSVAMMTKDSLTRLLETAEYFEEDTLMHFLREFVLVVDVRETKPMQKRAISFSSASKEQIAANQIKSTKDLGSVAPNLFMTQTGVSMNSIVTVRGFGSISGDPVVSINVDNVPVLNSDAFTMDLFDVSSVVVLRGPQGFSTGRNAMMGQINVYSLSPMEFQGTKVEAEYSSYNTVSAKVGSYQRPREKFGVSIVGKYKYSDGMFTNSYNGKKVDDYNGLDLRFRTVGRVSDQFTVDNVASASYLKEGAFPYARTDLKNEVKPISIDMENSYERFTFSDALVIQYKGDFFALTSVTGYQYMKDYLTYDADYSSKKLVVNKNNQKEHAISHEFALRSIERPEKKFNWKAGIFFFFKHKKSDNPVLYHRDGIDDVFCDDINKAVHVKYPIRNVRISGDQLGVSSEFILPKVGIALYQQSEYALNENWDFSIGARLNYEYSYIDYLNESTMEYDITALSGYPKEMNNDFHGAENLSELVLLPKFTAQYNFSKYAHVYATISRGHRAGGFNVSLFPDIIQNQMKNRILDELEINADENDIPSYDYAQKIHYNAENSWNFELGAHILSIGKRINVDADVFFVTGHDQQAHMFPMGKNIGSMVVNAERARSVGTEISINYAHTVASGNEFEIDGSYGYACARFTKFEHLGEKYDGKRLPLAPANTIGLNIRYIFKLQRSWIDELAMTCGLNGYGRIFWDVENRYVQPFYALFNASITYRWKNLEFSGFARNLANVSYNSYLLENLGNHYCERGTPREVGLSVSYKFKK